MNSLSACLVSNSFQSDTQIEITYQLLQEKNDLVS